MERKLQQRNGSRIVYFHWYMEIKFEHWVLRSFWIKNHCITAYTCRNVCRSLPLYH